MRRARPLLAVFIAVCCMLSACAPCGPDATAQGIAGPDAVPCGRVPIGLSSREADTCAVAAFRAGRPFVLRQDLPGVDSEVAEYYVRDPAGSMHRLLWDSDPSGGSHTGERIQEQPCMDPMIVVRGGFEQVGCTPGGTLRVICGQ